MEHELWFTALLNDFLAAPANAVLTALGFHAEARPWPNWFAMELLVALFLVVLFAAIRPGFSVDKPSKMQHLFEVIYEFLHGQAEDFIGHHQGPKYVGYFGTVFVFILFMNLIGLIPTFESPTMFVYVPCGVALATFCYYHWQGIKEHGIFKYLAHFAGPMPALALLMIPIEIISHLARPLSLTIRLYANMFAGEQVTVAFMKLVPILVPVVFMALHVFVSFLQAYIFTMLSMVYVGGAVAHEH